MKSMNLYWNIHLKGEYQGKACAAHRGPTCERLLNPYKVIKEM